MISSLKGVSIGLYAHFPEIADFFDSLLDKFVDFFHVYL
jgi:hypothetical protein